jgi:signal transduction histidine kinase
VNPGESIRADPRAAYVVAAASLAVITWFDLVTGYEFGLFVLYFVPVGIAAWWGSRWAGLAFAVAAAGCWFATDQLSHHPYTRPWLIYWETFMRLVSFLLTGWTLSRIREGVVRQEDLLRTVSHDLRAPLTALSGQAQILRAKAGEDPFVQARAEAILRAAHRMDGMIADLVDGAREATGQLRLELRPVELRGFVEELLGRMERALEVGRIDVALPRDPPLSVLADPARLERILVNLLSNALKYSPPGSRVRLEGRADGARVLLSVADRGPGIAPEDFAHLFERYFRGSRTEETAGIGLGLYGARALVEAHGGRIRAENGVDGGAVFTVELPAEA